MAVSARVGPDGVITTVAGAVGSFLPSFSGDEGLAINAHFSSIRGLATAADGSLFIADAAYNLRVRKVGPDGIVTTLAGCYCGYFVGLGDGGPATQAFMNQPWGLAVGPNGILYIADKDTNRIRRLTSGLANFSARTFRLPHRAEPSSINSPVTGAIFGPTTLSPARCCMNLATIAPAG